MAADRARGAWESFAAYAPTEQLRHIRRIAEYSPSIFKRAPETGEAGA